MTMEPSKGIYEMVQQQRRTTFPILSYFFLVFSTPEEAVNAVKAGHGYRLDKSHVFKANFFSDFEK